MSLAKEFERTRRRHASQVAELESNRSALDQLKGDMPVTRKLLVAKIARQAGVVAETAAMVVELQNLLHADQKQLDLKVKK